MCKLFSTVINVLIICYLTFCDDCQEWKPRYGYKRGNDETKEWLIEVPQNAGILF